MDCRAAVLGLSVYLVCGTCAGQSLKLANDLSLPFSSEYAVYRDASQSATFVYSLRQMRATQNSATGQLRVGAQYFTDPQAKTLKLALTATVGFAYEKDRLNAILTSIRKQTTSEASLALAVGQSVACQLFAIPKDNNVILGSVVPSSGSADSTIALTSTFDLKSKADLELLLRKSGRLGVICKVSGPRVAEAASAVIRIPVQNLLSASKTLGWIGTTTDFVQISRGLVEGPLGSSIPAEFRAQARSAIYDWLKAISGSPSTRVPLLSDPEWGWAFDSESVATRIRSAGPIVLSVPDLAQYVLQQFSVVRFDRLCDLAPTTIINLDSGTGGCDGL